MSRKLLVVAAALLLASCTPAVKDFRDGMRRGVAAQGEGKLAEAEKFYTAALDIADERGNDSESIFAGDAAAQMALAQKAPDRALAVYDRLFARYPAELGSFGNILRLPNNRGVLLARAGRLDEGIASIDGALRVLEGRGIAPSPPFKTHAMLALNLLAMHSMHPWEPGCEAAYQSTLGWAEADMERDQSGQYTPGAHALFRSLGDFASRGPRPGEAARLYEIAQASTVRQYSRDGVDDRQLCESHAIYKLATQVCLEVLE